MKKLIFAIIAVMFLGGCLESTYIGNPYVWTNDQVNAYYAKCPNLFALKDTLITDGYKWQSDGMNFNPLTDTVATPNFVLSHGGGNCNDLANLFQDYAQSTGTADEYIEYIIRSGYKWHSYTCFRVGDVWYMQSNISLVAIASPEASVEHWYSLGYQYREIVQKWNK